MRSGCWRGLAWVCPPGSGGGGRAEYAENAEFRSARRLRWSASVSVISGWATQNSAEFPHNCVRSPRGRLGVTRAGAEERFRGRRGGGGRNVAAVAVDWSASPRCSPSAEGGPRVVDPLAARGFPGVVATLTRCHGGRAGGAGHFCGSSAEFCVVDGLGARMLPELRKRCAAGVSAYCAYSAGSSGLRPVAGVGPVGGARFAAPGAGRPLGRRLVGDVAVVLVAPLGHPGPPVEASTSSRPIATQTADTAAASCSTPAGHDRHLPVAAARVPRPLPARRPPGPNVHAEHGFGHLLDRSPGLVMLYAHRESFCARRPPRHTHAQRRPAHRDAGFPPQAWYSFCYTLRVSGNAWDVYVVDEVLDWIDGLDDATHAPGRAGDRRAGRGRPRIGSSSCRHDLRITNPEPEGVAAWNSADPLRLRPLALQHPARRRRQGGTVESLVPRSDPTRRTTLRDLPERTPSRTEDRT